MRSLYRSHAVLKGFLMYNLDLAVDQQNEPLYLAQAYRSVVARPQVVLLEACRAAGTTVEAVRRRDKRERQSAARQLVWAILRSSGLSWWAIAILVDRDHSTVIYGVRRVRARRQVVLRCALQRFRAGA